MNKYTIVNLRASLKFRHDARKIKKQLKSEKYTHLYIGTPPYGNLGDQQIRNSSVELLKSEGKNFIELSYRMFYHLMGDYWFRYSLKNIKTICLQGGGNFGDKYIQEELIRDMVIRLFKDKKIIIFPQTYFVENKTKASEIYVTKEIFDRHKNLVITTREKPSSAAVKEMFEKNKVILTPDIVLSSNYTEKFKTERKNRALFLMRNDGEKAIDNKFIENIKKALAADFRVCEGDTEVDYMVFDIKRDAELNKLFKKIASSKIVITDRLHGMIFCAITSTPCIVFSNYNHKVKATYENWLSGLDYIEFVEDINSLDVKATIKRLSESKDKWSVPSKMFAPLIKEL